VSGTGVTTSLLRQIDGILRARRVHASAAAIATLHDSECWELARVHGQPGCEIWILLTLRSKN
jgi:hypothetical protein